MTDSAKATTGPRLTRRQALQVGTAGALVLGGAGVGVAALAGGETVSRILPTAKEVQAAERARPVTGQVVRRRLNAQATTVDLAGRQAQTWAFNGAIPARPIRATVGDQLQIELSNKLADSTTIHWHGLALRNDMDGVPGLTMDAVQPGSSFNYTFTTPDPGTYWFHPHVGVQLDTGLMGALIIEDPNEPLNYTDDVTLVLDDWTDDIGPSPKAVLADLGRNGMPGMSEMSMSGSGGVSATNPLGTDTGDVRYPLHLINGRAPADPEVVIAKPGARIRVRVINAGSDTAYRFAIGGHRLSVVATDGFPVEPVEVDSLILGMGERYDVLVTPQDGAFPILARPEGKPDPTAFAVLRTRAGDSTPRPRAAELGGQLLTYGDLTPTDAVALDNRTPDREVEATLQMRDGGRRWVINGLDYEHREPLDVSAGERVRLTIVNQTMMFHPMHLHGHTFAVKSAGSPAVRKDTVNVLPMQKLAVDIQADNPGQWLFHCHNTYHGELGMMTVLSYVR